MSQEKWFDKYANQSADELIRLKSEYRIDSLLSAFEEAVQSKSVNLGEASLSEPEKVILAIAELSREISDGGFSQFFYTSANEYADFIVHAFALIGCPVTAEIMKTAIEIVGLPEGSSQADYQNRLDEDAELSGKLETLDDRFFAYEEDIDAKLFGYIEANRGQISIVRRTHGKSGESLKQ